MDFNTPVNFSRDQLNTWLASRCPKAPAGLGGRIFDACMGSGINPGIMACIAISKSKSFTVGGDFFACGLGGDLYDQLVTAVGFYQRMTWEDLSLAESQISSIEIRWMGFQSWLRNDEPIPTPQPVPQPTPVPPRPPFPPKPEPKPEPEKPKKKNPPASLVRFSVVFGALATALGFASWFYPPLKPFLAAIVPLVKAILAAFGV